MRLVGGEFELVACPRCGGRGKIPCPPTIAVRSGIGGFNAKGGITQPGTGHPIPCPECKGKKTLPTPTPKEPGHE